MRGVGSGSIAVTARLLFDYSRGRQALLSAAQPPLGAVLALGGLPPARTALLGLLAAVAGSICVFSANDLFDLSSDRRETAAARDHEGAGLTRSSRASWDIDVVAVRHPLAAGAFSLWLGIAWVAVTGLTALLAALLVAPICAGIFAVCFLLETVYCSLKQRSWAKTAVAGVMCGLVGLAGWLAVAPFGRGAAAFFLLIAVWEIAGRNLSNDLADVSRDRSLGIKTVATVFGPGAAAFAILLGAVTVAAVAGLQEGAPLVRVGLVVVSLWLVTLPALRLSRQAGESAALVFFNRASLYPPVALVAALLVLLIP